MIEKREFFRFEHERRSNYHLPGEDNEWQECTIIDFSRNGMTIFSHERIVIGSLCSFEIPIPEGQTFITITGTLQWAEESEDGYKGGVALTTLLDDDNFRKLLTGHTLSDKSTSTESSEDLHEFSKETTHEFLQTPFTPSSPLMAGEADDSPRSRWRCFHTAVAGLRFFLPVRADCAGYTTGH